MNQNNQGNANKQSQGRHDGPTNRQQAGSQSDKSPQGQSPRAGRLEQNQGGRDSDRNSVSNKSGRSNNRGNNSQSFTDN